MRKKITERTRPCFKQTMKNKKMPDNKSQFKSTEEAEKKYRLK